MSALGIGKAIFVARKAQGVSRVELAQRVGVSTRLVAELERGERPNVSLTTALKLLTELGVALRLTEFQADSAKGDQGARLARVSQRRATWTGARWSLQDDNGPPAEVDAAARLMSVAEVSRRAYAIATAPRAAVPSTSRATRRPKE